ETKHHFKINGIKLSKGMKFLALKVTYQNNSGVPFMFIPLASKVETNNQSYKAMYFSVVGGDQSWIGGDVDPGQMLDLVITYEIPNHSENLKVIFNGFEQKGVTVKVDLSR
ncbi:MAG TPA: DUF4352 domain-containing protein, partial [Bacillales bacterium]|nr:DUF4352 domain-containing protein [Bacillales bacterium]